jgi:hypothetical protein
MLTHVDNRITYSGNGNATEFAYQFKILDRTDIKVLLTDADGKEKLLTKDYYVDVEKSVVRYPGYAVGAEVPESERPAVLPTGWKLTIYREVLVTQETDLPDQYPFNQVEDIGDKLTMICQQLTDTTNRSLKVNVSKSSDVSTTIPWESGKSFRINDSGTGIELTEDPAKVLPLVESTYAQAQAQAQIASASAEAAAKSEDSAKAYMNTTKDLSENVNVFIPSVDADGVMTWTNKAGLANPAPVNVKGAKGDKGEQGVKGDVGARGERGEQGPQGLQGLRGEKGDKGDAFKYTDFTATQLAALKGPKGDEGLQGATGATGPQGERGPQGLQGPAGNAATITIGNVTTSAPGTSASVTNRGTPSAVVLDFVLPRGEDGADGGVTVDEELSSTSTNPVQNNVIYNALLNKVGTKDIFYGFDLGSPTATIRWRIGSQVLGSLTVSNYTGTSLRATQDSDGNIINTTYAKKADISGMVKSVNNVKPDSNGNVSITVSGSGGVSTSESNTWSAQQNFHDLMLNREKYTTYVVNGTSDTPVTSTMVYAVTGAFTLNLATLAGALSASQSTVFTAYFAANADYSLTISNAGKLKYVGSASDVAITSAGMLLNILMTKDASGNLTSIVQASKLS